MFDGRNGISVRAVVCDDENAGQRVEDMREMREVAIDLICV